MNHDTTDTVLMAYPDNTKDDYNLTTPKGQAICDPPAKLQLKCLPQRTVTKWLPLTQRLAYTTHEWLLVQTSYCIRTILYTRSILLVHVHCVYTLYFIYIVLPCDNYFVLLCSVWVYWPLSNHAHEIDSTTMPVTNAHTVYKQVWCMVEHCTYCMQHFPCLWLGKI